MFPAYPRKPHASGQARIRVNGRDVYLGVWGSPESRVEYARLARDFASGHKPCGESTNPVALTVAAVVAQFLDDAEKTRDKREYTHFRDACKVLLSVVGDLLASDFDAAALRLVRAEMSGRWCLRVTNRQIGRIKTLWRWAEANKLVPRGSWEHLRSLPPLTRRSPGVRVTRPKEPVSWETVQATLPHLPPIGVGMVLFQWWSGARPSEVCRATIADIDTTSVPGCWLLSLDTHKTDGKTEAPRVLVIGPEGQRAATPFLAAGQLSSNPGQLPLFASRAGTAYTVHGYARMLTRAIRKGKVPHWSLYQIRHAAKRRIERLAGEQGARAFLGQQSVESTRGYAARQDVELAAEIARRAG